MAKKINDIDELISRFLGDMERKDPALLEKFLDGMQKRKNGEGIEILDELRDFESDKHEVSTKDVDDYDIPWYVDFWDYYDGAHSRQDYEELMDECSKKKKTQLTNDINLFLESVPTFYREQYSLVSHQAWMIAAPILKYNLKKCHVPMLNLLRCEDYVIQDLFMDDETASYDMFAEMCHDQLQELHAIAIDDNVMPFARGVAIASLAKSIEFSTKDSLLIFNLLKNIIETYRDRAKSDRKVSVAIIRATSLAAARMHLHNLLPLIEETYRKLRISTKGIGAIRKVKKLMDDETAHLGIKESVIDNLETFLDFQENIFGDTFDELRNEDEEDDFDDEYTDAFEKYEYGDDDEEGDDDFDDDDDSDWELPEITLDNFRKTKVINGKVKILGEDFTNAHPKGLSTVTDKNYIEFANSICKRITGIAIDLENDDIKSIAMKCTLYYEDMIADAGIWRSFIDKMREMYGRPLPFHHVDEANYYPDEPNLADVKLLVWLACLDSHTSAIFNPENDTLMEIAEAIYELMDDKFEQMPVNEALYDYFHDAPFMNDYYEARDAVKWAYLSSYISSTTKGLTVMIDVANAFQKIYGLQGFYQAESTLIYDTCIGPLGLTATEWLAMILRSNGKRKEAEQIVGMKGTSLFYHVEERNGDIFTVKGPDNNVVTFDRTNLDEMVDGQISNDYFFACLVPFKNEWYLSGLCSWSNRFREKYNEQNQKYEAMKRAGVPEYEKLLQGNNGSPLFYFKDTTQARKFLTDAGIKDVNNISLLLSNDKNCVLFFPAKDKPFTFIPDIAKVIKDPNNPYYNEKAAMEDRIVTPLNIPYVLASYLFEHNYLPYAGFRNQHGDEIGRRQFRENYDFLLRCLAPGNMESSSASNYSNFKML